MGVKNQLSVIFPYLSLLTAHSGTDSPQPSLSNILGNPGNPDLMISDVAGGIEVCL